MGVPLLAIEVLSLPLLAVWVLLVMGTTCVALGDDDSFSHSATTKQRLRTKQPADYGKVDDTKPGCKKGKLTGDSSG